MNARWLVPLACLMLCVGCARQAKTIADTFPVGSRATPWILQGAVWSGTFDRAASAVGDDADEWRRFKPTRVWLAVYHHETTPKERVTVRAFAFDTPADAHAAFDGFKPKNAQPFAAGSEGCWTNIGVLFRWGCLVFDIFGDDASFSSQRKAAYLTAFIEGRMPAGLPDAPR